METEVVSRFALHAEFAGDSRVPILVVGTHLDELGVRSSKKVLQEFNTLFALYQEQGFNIQAPIFVSCKNGKNIK